MAATFDWQEDNSTATGSPAKGTTRTTGRTEVNWKNLDDSVTSYNTVPVTAGNNSFTKYQFGKFSGTFTTISAGLFAHTAGTLGAGLTLISNVTSTYATPGTSTLTGTDITSAISIGSGATVLFVATGPETASPGSSCSTNPCYTQYLQTQMQTTVAASPGDSATVTLTLQYQEH
jgi:hypothetical protein